MTIKAIRHRMGLAVRRFLGLPLQQFALERLQQAGFQPREMLDIGASDGVFTEEAWALWPDLSSHCFEPDPEYVTELHKKAARDKRMHVCQDLVGAKAAKSVTYYHHLGASTVLPENRLHGTTSVIEANGPERQCGMITLDDYCREKNIKPDFLKMDVQGYEMEVLRGAEKVLPGVEVILTEVNHIEVYAGAPLAAELIGYLAERGYALHDVCNFNRRPLDEALWQTDMVFVRHSSKLRSRKSWEQSGS